jgi:non-specific serine/threonine protein kinase
VLAALLVVLTGFGGGGEAGWKKRAPMPLQRSEVAAAAYQGGVAVVGGFTIDGSSSKEVDLYLPTTNRWKRLPDLPIAVNHAMAAASGGKLYVAGGYRAPPRVFTRFAFVLDEKKWRSLPPMPSARAAGGAAIVGGKLYVVGGVAPTELAQTAFAFDLATKKWSTIPGPTPREHLAVTATGGRVYAIAGRLGGDDANLATFEAYSTAAGTWATLPSVPQPRGGTGAAVAGGMIVSVGGEEPAGTIRTVYGYVLATGDWRRLPNLPTARHGLAVAAVRGTVYAIGGGTSPGLSTSAVNEALTP